MEWLTDPDIWIGFVTLLGLEIVLGIDNVVFISILAGKLPAAQRARARQIGLGLALGMRVARSTYEIHDRLEGDPGMPAPRSRPPSPPWSPRSWSLMRCSRWIR